MGSRLANEYEFVAMHQDRATGGIDVARLREWATMLRDVKPDLVHVRGLGNEGFHGVMAARLAGCPKILVSVHGTQRDLTGPMNWRRRLVVNGLEPATLSLATHITTVCQFAAERSFVTRHRAKFVGPLVNGVPLMPEANTVRTTVRRSLDLTEGDVAIVAVGRLSWEKGHADLASALELAPPEVRERIVLVLVGDGPDAVAIHARYQIKGLRTRLLGLRLDVADILRASDVFAFPSWHENLSNALIEAMMAGLPVVATDVGGNTEVVRKGGGVLVPPHDPTHLQEALSGLVVDQELRAVLGEQARENAEANYSTDAMLDSVDRVYRKVLDAK